MGVAVGIYRRQKRDIDKDREKLKVFFKAELKTQAEQFVRSLGQPITPELTAKVDQFAGTSATILTDHFWGTAMTRTVGFGAEPRAIITPQATPPAPILIPDEGKPPKAKPDRIIFAGEDEKKP